MKPNHKASSTTVKKEHEPGRLPYATRAESFVRRLVGAPLAPLQNSCSSVTDGIQEYRHDGNNHDTISGSRSSTQGLAQH